MPVRMGKDSEGPYYQCGTKGAKYHYKANDAKSRLMAKGKADAQCAIVMESERKRSKSIKVSKPKVKKSQRSSEGFVSISPRQSQQLMFDKAVQEGRNPFAVARDIDDANRGRILDKKRLISDTAFADRLAVSTIADRPLIPKSRRIGPGDRGPLPQDKQTTQEMLARLSSSDNRGSQLALASQPAIIRTDPAGERKFSEIARVQRQPQTPAFHKRRIFETRQMSAMPGSDVAVGSGSSINRRIFNALN